MKMSQNQPYQGLIIFCTILALLRESGGNFLELAPHVMAFQTFQPLGGFRSGDVKCVESSNRKYPPTGPVPIFTVFLL